MSTPPTPPPTDDLDALLTLVAELDAEEQRIRAARRAQRFAGAGAKRSTRPRAARGTT